MATGARDLAVHPHLGAEGRARARSDSRRGRRRARWRRCASRARSSRATSRSCCGRRLPTRSSSDGFGGDVDRLYVAQCFANQGPSMKRIRPAPMGRAFRVVKRMAHLTVEVAERPAKVRHRVGAGEPGRRARSERGEGRQKPATSSEGRT